MMGSTRYNSHVATAQTLAQHIGNVDTPSYKWLSPITATSTDDLAEDPVNPLLEPVLAAVDYSTISEAYPDTDATLLGNYLLEYDPEPADLDEINPSPIQTIWRTPVRCKHCI